jgi:hypothetical protein
VVEDSFTFGGTEFTLTATGDIQMATGGSVIDVQAPQIRIGTEGSGESANDFVLIGNGTTEYVRMVAGLGQVESSNTHVFHAAAGIDIENAAGVALAVGDVLAVKASVTPTSVFAPKVTKASNDDATAAHRRFCGVALGTVADTVTGYAAAIAGTICGVNFKSGEEPSSSAQVGSPVYIADTAGEATMTEPAVSGQTKYIIGHLVSATAISGARYAVQLAPQYVGEV